ncbi:hypothetical protein N7541_003251 [Penicillium brevicompactum]|uniref:Nephrocystin 3-like N-terminal domain-containing protein n=1 Tax=Penicillium brevicompactum TaxID=5074 RepID=A0A9W9RLG4_PENBR|nr:hypothetical protein N7541_003251 [Penicillium brevicompactum]
MRSLRAICCSRGEERDDGQDTAVRPSQQRSEKETHSVPTNVKKETTETDLPPEKSPRRNLWALAFDGLDDSRKKHIPADGLPATDAIQGVIDETTAKYKEWQEKGLTIHRKNGKNINVRDTAEKIMGAAMEAQGAISTLVSFDPTGHASSAWTVISFGMSIVQNRLDRRDAIFQSSEYLAETLAYFAIVDVKYRNQGVESDERLDQALLKVYSAILEFTAEVKKGQDENEASRTLHSIFALTDQPLSQLKSAIGVQYEITKKWLVLAANLGDRKRADDHLAKTDENIKISKNIESKVQTLEEENILAWVSNATYSDRQRELQAKRLHDTGVWILDSPEYNDWKYTAGDILWLPGISGCGKSVLCSTVIQDLEDVCRVDPSRSLAYWYFQFGVNWTQSVNDLARSLIRQLSRSPLVSSVKDLWKEHHQKGSQPDSKAILAVLNDIISSISGQVYLVFDALDECPGNVSLSQRESLLSLLTDLIEQHKDKVHILATSRPEQDISQQLREFSMFDLESYLAEDVKTFVTAATKRDPLQFYSEEVKTLIFDALVNSKERRFRWAELQIQALEKRRKRRTGNEDDIREALKKVPLSLEETYRRILESDDPDDDVVLAREILMIICLSPVVLDVNTVAEMVDLDIPDDVLKICTTSLVSVFDDKIQLAHFSVQEFLMFSDKGGQRYKCQFSAAEGHRFLAKKALDSLLEQTDFLAESEADERLSFLYAARFWGSHTAALEDIDRSCPDFQAKLDRIFVEPNVYFNWMRVANPNLWSCDIEELPQTCERPILRASSMGLEQAVHLLLEQGADPDGDTYFRPTPLNLAMSNGHEKTVQILLDGNADPNIGMETYPIFDASSAGDEKMVQMLLDHGADVNGSELYYGSALQIASAKGYEMIVQMLLDGGADVNQPGHFSYALNVASANGHERIVQLLLDKGADVDSYGEDGTPLMSAISGRYEEITQMLLDRGANVNTDHYEFGTPLQLASATGLEKMVQIVLDRGADVNFNAGCGLVEGLVEGLVQGGEEGEEGEVGVVAAVDEDVGEILARRNVML